MTTTHILVLIAGLIIGGATGVLSMCLVALGKLGDDPLPEDTDAEASKRLRIPADLTPHQPLVRPTQYQD